MYRTVSNRFYTFGPVRDVTRQGSETSPGPVKEDVRGDTAPGGAVGASCRPVVGARSRREHHRNRRSAGERPIGERRDVCTDVPTSHSTAASASTRRSKRRGDIGEPHVLPCECEPGAPWNVSVRGWSAGRRRGVRRNRSAGRLTAVHDVRATRPTGAGGWTTVRQGSGHGRRRSTERGRRGTCGGRTSPHEGRRALPPARPVGRSRRTIPVACRHRPNRPSRVAVAPSAPTRRAVTSPAERESQAT